jgi:type II secretory ATPase GspE/PulE/Tfp pilus assembly ATPase PilB-like protein
MDRTIDGHSDRRTTSPDRSCPLCGEQVQESQYPRHRITLADESDTAPNQLVNGRVCRDCWHDLYTDLAAAN